MAANSRRRKIRQRAERCFQLCCLGFGVLVVQMVRLQVVEHSRYSRLANEFRARTICLTAPRGAIRDRHGHPLALTVMRQSVFADPQQVDDQPGAAQKLAPLLGLDPIKLTAALARPGRFVWLKRRLEDPVAKQVADLKLPGIGLIAEPYRVYPQGELAAQVLGFVGESQAGMAGVELALDRALRPHPGKVEVELDAKRRVIPASRRQLLPPRPGRDVWLTLDLRVQQIAEAELAQALQQHHAAAGTILVVDPDTGDILALASQPAFDPNRYQEYRSEPWRWTNRTITNPYEPGSTFKLVAACAALEEHLVTSNQVVLTCTGSKQVGKRVIHCALHAGSRAHGTLTLHGIIEKSCNIGAATLALRLGGEKFYHYVRLLGFGHKTGLGLPGEANGWVSAHDDWQGVKLANIGFGQGVTVTAPQLLRAYCVVANAGKLPQLHLVAAVADSQGRRVQQPFPAARQVISPGTALKAKAMFESVVEEGTGKAARLEGYRALGKTGTAQMPRPGVGYRSGDYVGSFVGFAPADTPRLGIVVVIDRPQGSHYGGVVAAPAFKAVAQQALVYLGVPPTQMMVKSLPAAAPASAAE